MSEEMTTYGDKVARRVELQGLSTVENRTIPYNFGPAFLDLQVISLSIEFYYMGSEPLNDLQLIEKHWFRKRLLSTFEFKFPTCIPNSKNEVEFVYELPKFTEEEKKVLSENPWETISDSFFFAKGQLLIHNRAAYNYAEYNY